MSDDDAPLVGEAERGTASQTEAGRPAFAGEEESRRRIPWGWLILVLLIVELGLYGSNGHVEVCVGKDGAHDFELIGQPRTDESRWRFPRCESRMNLGLRSSYTEQVDDAVRIACRGVTTFQHRGESQSCMHAEAGWIQRIQTHPCFPWHGHFWSHMFWFLR